MQQWKQAWRIAQLELSHSIGKFFLGYLIVIIFSGFFVFNLQGYLSNGFIFYDMFFILFFIIGANMGPDHFRSKQHFNFAHPLLITQLQLPIEQNILIKSRFVIHFCFTLPVQILFLVVFYLTSPISGLLSIPAYIAFAIIWLSVNLYMGTLLPMSEAIETGFATRIGTVIIAVIIFFIFLFILSGSHLITDHGVVELSIIVAKKWPLIASAISLIIGLAAVKAHQVYMKKFLNKLDYL
ncbi:hypothetical protein J32TS6_23620 [Virgibacillus pantothenticus]|uniref:Permease n=1 Tax=Virgibacillus pantothenticus TaxID=1473 RepID=A0A0L0QS66_VIRPA|nr:MULTISPECIES: hypothetical protein [Virgibacillus]API91942.1 hypothetical protein BKP57_08920 [Virgibacillus sp. 6R]KNE21426.1 hypothetical protein AFK71_07120 [Virgibacillus pantothenticus]MBS7430392.1 hypothetical protein [Virgibacillus sp. 19R1-5]MBU8567338.1 hypothetical protein [Virgibacillus pantothenticus]MBU8598919.1 hypothetical protein [Virgibacillus pantothenticus]